MTFIRKYNLAPHFKIDALLRSINIVPSFEGIEQLSRDILFPLNFSWGSPPDSKRFIYLSRYMIYGL